MLSDASTKKLIYSKQKIAENGNDTVTFNKNAFTIYRTSWRMHMQFNCRNIQWAFNYTIPGRESGGTFRYSSSGIICLNWVELRSVWSRSRTKFSFLWRNRFFKSLLRNRAISSLASLKSCAGKMTLFTDWQVTIFKQRGGTCFNENPKISV